VYPVLAPADAAAPYITYRLLRSPRDYTLGGLSGPGQSVYRLTIWSSGYLAARNLAAAIAAAAAAFAPEDAGSWSAITGMAMLDEADEFEPLPELVERQFYGRWLDLQIDFAV
jgi:hypothetical protein